jgi:hypothetical protein
MKVFISHKKEDELEALRINIMLKSLNVDSYLDLLDPSITGDGKALTDHIKNQLNDCTDIIVVMSEATRFSQWVPFEVGMSAQIDMPTANYLKEGVDLPSFLSYWPRLKTTKDVETYIQVRRKVENEMKSIYEDRQFNTRQKIETEKFYAQLKFKLNQR